MPIYSNMPEDFYPRPSDVDAPLRSPIGRGPRGPQGHSITAEIVDNDPYGYFRVRFKDAQTGEVLVVTPNLDVGSRIFVTSEYAPLNETSIGATHSMPSSDLTPLQASSDRSAVRVGDLIVFNAHTSDATLATFNTFGIGVVNRVDNQRGDGTFVDYDVVHFVVTNVITGQIAPGSITADMLADNAVTTPKIADGAVSTAKLANDAVTNDKLANNAVTTDNLANGSVTTPKLANNSVTNQKIANSSVTSTKIADGSVTTSKIANSAVVTNKIANGSVTSQKILDGAVIPTKIPDGTIGTTKLANGSVTTEKIKNRSVTLEKLSEEALVIEGPTFADPIEWNGAQAYDAFTVVTHNGNSYTSRANVPIGVDISNEDYWVETGNYNAQLQEYIDQVSQLSENLNQLAGDVDGIARNIDDITEDIDSIEEVLPIDKFSSTSTVSHKLQSNNEYTNIACFGISYTSVSAGQCAVWYNDYLYQAGQTSGGVIMKIDTTTGKDVLVEYNTEIGHGNGICVYNDYIYVAAETKLLKFDPDDLSLLDEITLPSWTSNVFVYEDSFCGLNGDKIFKFDLENQTSTEIASVSPIDGSASQDACAINDIIYIGYTMPNYILAIDASSNTQWIKALPDGDGNFPANELEGLFEKDGKLCIECSTYRNNGYNYNGALPINNCFYFYTDITGDTISLPLQFYSDDFIFADGNRSETFTPSRYFKYLSTLSFVINYKRYAKVYVQNLVIDDVLFLNNASASLTGTSGNRNIKDVILNNSTLLTSSISVTNKLTAYQSKIFGIFSTENTITEFTVNYSAIDIEYFNFVIPSTSSIVRSTLKLIGSSNTSLFEPAQENLKQSRIECACSSNTKFIMFGLISTPLYATIINASISKYPIYFTFTAANARDFIGGIDVTITPVNPDVSAIKFIAGTATVKYSLTSDPDTFINIPTCVIRVASQTYY